MDDRWIADWPPSERWPHYTRSNAGEVLATPASPLGQQFVFDNGMVLGWRDGYVRMGFFVPGEMSEKFPEPCGFFGGYFYINLSNVRMQGVRSPVVTVEQLDLAFFGEHPDVPPYVADPRDDNPDLVPGILRHVGWVMSTTSWPEIDEEKAEMKALRRNRPDVSTMTDDELVARARSLQPWLVKLFETHTVSSSSSGIAPGILFAVGQAIGDPTVPMKLISGIGDVDSAEPSYALWELSRLVRGSAELAKAFDAGVDGLLDRLGDSGTADAKAFLTAFDEFTVDFGSRGPNEWEISADSWETNPRLPLIMLDRIRLQTDAESPRNRNTAKVTERLQVIEEVRAKVQALGEELTGQFEGALIASNMQAFRERTKSTIVIAVNELRVIFNELGRRHAAAGDIAQADYIFMLLDEEVEQFVASPTGWNDTFAERYEMWRELFDREPPYFIRDAVVPPISTWAKRGKADVATVVVGDVLQGVAGCPGVITGRACVIMDPSDPRDLGPGDILVAPQTDPGWTPLFMAAEGVVVNVGGQISHAIIVSRELGLPCVVSVKDATSRIPDGAIIEVDGNNGTVTVLEVPAA
ncbi:MAG: PEP-utilizing enzyme [Actinomycetota bacterium]|nr:PEP-utilizing enzyme [Actinomycetota bacterium]